MLFCTKKSRKKTEQLQERVRELKETQKELNLEKDRFLVLTEKSPFGVSIISSEGRYLYLNPKFTSLFGYTLEDVPTGREWFNKAFPDRQLRRQAYTAWVKLKKNPQTGLRGPQVFPVVCQDNTEKIIHFLPVNLSTGEQFIIYEDISDRVASDRELRNMEEQLSQAQKMEAIGTLAGGIAHDFNNILSIILTHNELAAVKLPPDNQAARHLEQVNQAAERAVDLVRQILTFGRQTEPDRKPLDFDQVMKEALEFLRAILPSNVELKYNVVSNPGRVMADPTQIHQVMINLCANAAHAMQDRGGVLTITLSDFQARPDSSDHHELKPGRYLRLSVQDTGSGMDKKTLDRIFEPFFTTKSGSDGTGLGLSVVHGIIKKHGGAIKVHSSPGTGSTFETFFPIINTIAEEAPSPKMAPKTGTEHILFVDDEESMVDAAREILEALGYSVSPFTSSLEALNAFWADPYSYDLIITDQTMPKLTGLTLAKEMIRRRPDIPVVLCTGYSRHVSAESAAEAGIRRFCMKPFTIARIAEAVRSALDEYSTE